MTLSDLATPALLIDETRLQRNIDRMQARAEANDVILRPHIKTHKSIEIAERQRAAGAQGLTVATVREAEVFAEAGFKDIRLAYAVVGRTKHERLLQLMARGVNISFCVDTPAGMKQAATFYASHNRTADVLLEVDVGHGRCGVGWDSDAAVDLARLITRQEGLRLAGLLTHGGQAYHGPGPGETPEAALVRHSTEERNRMLKLAARLRAADVPGVTPDSFTLSIGSTPTMAAFENHTHENFRITEIRPGNYVCYDAMQVGLRAATLDDCALTVLATVISRHTDGKSTRLYLDAGKKIITTDTGTQTAGHGILLESAAARKPMASAALVGLSEEHGWARVAGQAPLAVGDRVELIPNHACVTIGTQDHAMLQSRDGTLERLPIDARAHG